eukprot:3500386-Karenia_brevis.AAC.1
MFPSRQKPEVEDVLCKPAIRVSVLALASWIQLTEEWHSGPFDSAQRLAYVSNQGPMHLRQVGLPVHRERVQSSTPHGQQ